MVLPFPLILSTSGWFGVVPALDTMITRKLFLFARRIDVFLVFIPFLFLFHFPSPLISEPANHPPPRRPAHLSLCVSRFP